MTADIKLNDGWIPIGEGARVAAASGLVGTAEWEMSGTPFCGEFDGNGHIISNLNNKNFEPSNARIGIDGNSKTYTYGLFALTASGANIHDLILKDVDIDTTRYSEAIGDSVGALVGFSGGTLTVNNVKVMGNSSVTASEAAAGLVGRCYWQDKSENCKVSITNCENNANIETVSSGTYAAGIVGYINLNDTSRSHDITINNNVNNGDVSQPNHLANGSNIAGIAMINGDDWSDKGFIHSGNKCTGTLKNGTQVVTNLFCKMSNAIYITSED